MAWLPREIASDKVLPNKAFNIAKIAKYDSYQLLLTAIVCKFFDKKFSGADTSIVAVTCANKSTIQSKNMLNQRTFYLAMLQLAEELHKPVLENLKPNNYTRLLKTIFVVLILQICN